MTADLPEILTAAGEEHRVVALLESDGTLHATVWCPARRRGGSATTANVAVRPGTGSTRITDHQLCDTCRLTTPGLKSLAREGACRVALAELARTGTAAALEETGPLWEVLSEHGSGCTPRTCREAGEAVAALEAEWGSWGPERLSGGDLEVWGAVTRDSSGPGIAVTTACSRAELDEYRILVVPRRYRETVERHTFSSAGGPARPGDTAATYETAFTLWLDGTEADGDDLPRALEKARLVHLQ